MIPRIKKIEKNLDSPLSKEQFLEEHNKLSDSEWRATIDDLIRFETEKPDICKNGKWSIERARRPFVMWLASFRPRKNQ